MVFHRGDPRSPAAGRKPGTPNAVTREVRAMLRAALDRVGGEDYLIAQAKANPQAFLSLIAKLIPSEISGQLNVTGLAGLIAKADQSDVADQL